MFPVTFADANIDLPAAPHDFHNHEDEAVYKLCRCQPSILGRTSRAESSSDNPKLFHGLPVGLQLIGGTQEEEAVIAMTEIVDAALAKFKS